MLRAIHTRAVRTLSEGLRDLGVFPQQSSQAIEQHTYRMCFPHSVGAQAPPLQPQPVQLHAPCGVNTLSAAQTGPDGSWGPCIWCSRQAFRLHCSVCLPHSSALLTRFLLLVSLSLASLVLWLRPSHACK